jgi:AraC-like DNA-binding protein
VKRRCVRIRLAAIQNWPERAAQANYRVDQLAEDCQASRGTLLIFFAVHFHKSIKQWLREQRIREVQAKLESGECLKNISGCLGYHDLAHLTHDFESVCGISPAKWKKLATNSTERNSGESVGRE